MMGPRTSLRGNRDKGHGDFYFIENQYSLSDVHPTEWRIESLTDLECARRLIPKFAESRIDG